MLSRKESLMLKVKQFQYVTSRRSNAIIAHVYNLWKIIEVGLCSQLNQSISKLSYLMQFKIIPKRSPLRLSSITSRLEWASRDLAQNRLQHGALLTSVDQFAHLERIMNRCFDCFQQRMRPVDKWKSLTEHTHTARSRGSCYSAAFVIQLNYCCSYFAFEDQLADDIDYSQNKLTPLSGGLGSLCVVPLVTGKLYNVNLPKTALLSMIQELSLQNVSTQSYLQPSGCDSSIYTNNKLLCPIDKELSTSDLWIQPN